MRRSMLFLPGATPSIVTHGGTLQSDSIIIDLEDAVSPLEKDAARILTKQVLAGSKYMFCEKIVRINGLDTPFWQQDLEEIIPSRPDVILCPKINSTDDLEILSAKMDSIESAAGMELGTVKIMCLIETSRGVKNAYSIADFGGRVIALFFGAADFSADMQISRTKSGFELLYAKSRIVNACRSAQIDCYDTPCLEVEDADLLRQECQDGRALGFTGKAAINPRQVHIINEAFSPSEAEIKEAHDVLAALEHAKKMGRGVITLGNRMIDKPDILKAERILNFEKSLRGEMPYEE